MGRPTMSSGPPVCEDAVTVAAPGSRDPLDHFLTATGVSAVYLDNCAGCHGEAGLGLPGIVGVRGARTLAEFAQVVRNGRGTMPAFPERLYPQAALQADFARLGADAPPLQAALPPGFRDVPLPPFSPITDDEHQSALVAGLRALRMPGTFGACASCHAPDGIDLARIGYSRSHIVRRSLAQGRSPVQAMAIADLVAANRRFFDITTPCSPTLFRPLQPGGRILSEDADLGQELRARGLPWDQAPSDRSEALTFVKSAAALDVGKVPIVMPLSRWSADAIFGRADHTTNDWIPELALEPPNPEAADIWARLTNQYLETPNERSLWALYAGIPQLNGARFGAAGGMAERLAREKFRALLLMSHQMRTGHRGRPYFDGVADWPKMPQWEAAQIAGIMARGCAETSTTELLPCWKAPDRFFDKMGRDRTALITDLRRFASAWFLGGWLEDPGLQLTERGAARLAALGDALEAEGDRPLPFFHVYVGFERVTKAVATPDLNLPIGRGLTQKPVAGCWARASVALNDWTSETLGRLMRWYRTRPGSDLDVAFVFAENATSAILFEMEAAMDRPPAGCAQWPPDEGIEIGAMLDHMRAFGRPGSMVAAANAQQAMRLAMRLQP